MSIRCIVADDEPLAKMLLEKYIERTEGLDLVASFTSAIEANRAIAAGSADVAFLDIQMPGLTGLDLAREAEKAVVRVVFTTAYRDYALDGFRVNALDYLLKPISYDEFRVAADRAIAAIAPPAEPDTITVRSNYRNVRVSLGDILFVEGLRDYVKIHLRSEERPILTQINLKAVESQLLPPAFVRVHRSYIVAINAVKSFSRTKITIETPLEVLAIPVGDTYRAQFYQVMSSRK